MRTQHGDLDDVDPDKAGRVVDALKHHLLYCESVAIDDPLPFVLAFDRKTSFSRTRQRFISYLGLLYQLRELVDAGIVILVEPNFWEAIDPFEELNAGDRAAHAAAMDPYGRSSSYLRRYARMANPYSELEFGEENGKGIVDLVEKAADFSDLPEHTNPGFWMESESAEGMESPSVPNVVWFAVELIRIGFAARLFHKHRLDLYLPYAYFEQVLRELMKRGLESTNVASANVTGMDYVQRLLEIDLPRLENLSNSDVVSIRRNDRGFSDFRYDLENAVAKLRAMSPEEANDEEERRIVWAEISRGKKDLESNIGKSDLLSQVKARAVDFVFGVAPIWVLGDNLEMKAKALGITAFLKLAYECGVTALQRQSNAARNNHYLLFKPDDSRG